MYSNTQWFTRANTHLLLLLLCRSWKAVCMPLCSVCTFVFVCYEYSQIKPLYDTLNLILFASTSQSGLLKAEFAPASRSTSITRVAVRSWPVLSLMNIHFFFFLRSQKYKVYLFSMTFGWVKFVAYTTRKSWNVNVNHHVLCLPFLEYTWKPLSLSLSQHII